MDSTPSAAHPARPSRPAWLIATVPMTALLAATLTPVAAATPTVPATAVATAAVRVIPGSDAAAAAATGFRAVSVGEAFACATTAKGSVVCWGNGDHGQLGSRTAMSTVPRSVARPATSFAPRTVSSGGWSSCVVAAGGRVYCWGGGSHGENGNGSTADVYRPTPVTTTGVLAGRTVTAVSSGYHHACALDSAGRAYCWGANDVGQLGDGTTRRSLVPVAVVVDGALAGRRLVAISAGETTTCALDSTGAAYCWGWGATNSTTPVRVDGTGAPAGMRLTSLSVGGGGGMWFVCALDSAGTAYCWGNNGSGQLGIGSYATTYVPTAVRTAALPTGRRLVGISAGAMHACAVDAAGRAYCWGNNESGRLGTGAQASSPVPRPVVANGALKGQVLRQISAGAFDTCAVATSGRAFCWGNGAFGQLGNGRRATSPVPVAVVQPR